MTDSPVVTYQIQERSLNAKGAWSKWKFWYFSPTQIHRKHALQIRDDLNGCYPGRIEYRAVKVTLNIEVIG